MVRFEVEVDLIYPYGRQIVCLLLELLFLLYTTKLLKIYFGSDHSPIIFVLKRVKPKIENEKYLSTHFSLTFLRLEIRFGVRLGLVLE